MSGSLSLSLRGGGTDTGVLPCSAVLRAKSWRVLRDQGSTRPLLGRRLKEAGWGEAGAFQKSPGHTLAVPPASLRGSPNAPGGKGFPSLRSRPEDQRSQSSTPPGRGLGGRAQGTHHRSRRCAVAVTCRTPVRRRAETPGGKRGRNLRAAGRREDSGEARGVAVAQAHSLATAPGSTRGRGGLVAMRAWIREGRRLEAHQAAGVCSAPNRPLGLPPPLGCFLRPPSLEVLPGPRGEHRLFSQPEPVGREPRQAANGLGRTL